MRTPLYNNHVKLGAKIVDFHGWDMPVWYSGIREEHMATREHAGLFDASHMGEIYVDGPESSSFLNKLLTIETSLLPEGKIRYAFMLNPSGGIIDDLLVYCIVPGSRYMLCVNSSNLEKDFSWMKGHMIEGMSLEDRSHSTSLIALQGPEAGKILKKTAGFDMESEKYYTFSFTQSPFGELLVSRTGYTGSDGVEIFLKNEDAPRLWDSFIEGGAVPCGLGARDTLRLEMGYALHGNDIDETTSPLESGPMFAVDMKKSFFIGRDILDKQLNEGVKKRLFGLVMEVKGIPRQGYLCTGDGISGVVTSGSISPVLNTGIALAYLDASAKEGDQVNVAIRDMGHMARIKRPPFVKTGLTK